MDKKKLIIGLGVILLISLIILVISLVNKPSEDDYNLDGIKLPEYKEVLKDAEVGNLKITSVALLTIDGKSTFKAKAVNTLDKDLIINKLIMVVSLDGEKEKIEILRDTKIASLGETYINVTFARDLSGVSKIEYVLE